MVYWGRAVPCDVCGCCGGSSVGGWGLSRGQCQPVTFIKSYSRVLGGPHLCTEWSEELISQVPFGSAALVPEPQPLELLPSHAKGKPSPPPGRSCTWRSSCSTHPLTPTPRPKGHRFLRGLKPVFMWQEASARKITALKSNERDFGDVLFRTGAHWLRERDCGVPCTSLSSPEKSTIRALQGRPPGDR